MCSSAGQTGASADLVGKLEAPGIKDGQSKNIGQAARMMEAATAADNRRVRPTISVVVVSRNEAHTLAACLDSVAWADEVVVLDLQSEDSTAELCLDRGVKLHSHAPVPYADLVKQQAVNLASGEWVLTLDPDERATDALAITLQSIAACPLADAYEIPFRTFAFGREMRHGHFALERHVRFFRRNAVTWPAELHAVPRIAGTCRALKQEDGCILHHAWTTVDSVLARIRRYAPDEAKALVRGGFRPSTADLLYWPASHVSRQLLLNEGFRDGPAGVLASFLMGAYVLFSYGMAWESTAPQQSDDAPRPSDHQQTLRVAFFVLLELLHGLCHAALVSSRHRGATFWCARIARKLLRSLLPRVRPRYITDSRLKAW